MKTKGIGVGVAFIFVGIIAILIQFNVIDFSVISFAIRNIGYIIAAILIVTGINLIFQKYYFVKIITWITFFIVLFLLSYLNSDNSSNKNYEANDFFEVVKREETDFGELQLNIGAVRLMIGSTDANLIEGNINAVNFEDPVVTYRDDNKRAHIKIDTASSFTKWNIDEIFSRSKRISNENSYIFLNQDVLWDINLNLGAVDKEFNMSQLRVGKLDVNGGAGSLKLIVGEKHEHTKISVKAGVSGLEIYVPKNSGVKLSSTGVLNSLDIVDLHMIKNNGYYVSETYEESENKIEIDIKMGIGSVTIKGIDE
ncbi:UNVERIFIED_CONTAM: cell wall-active antibiotic response 4TMS protein YvqF [Acetivibrio alkalicellulosi]